MRQDICQLKKYPLQKKKKYTYTFKEKKIVIPEIQDKPACHVDLLQDCKVK